MYFYIVSVITGDVALIPMFSLDNFQLRFGAYIHGCLQWNILGYIVPDPTDDKSTLIQVYDWSQQVSDHHLS